MLPEPNDSLPGRAFAYAISSFTECTGRSGLTTSTFGVMAISVIGAKSFCASYGIFAYRLGLTACVESAPITTV